MNEVNCFWNQGEDFGITLTENQIVKILYGLGLPTYPAYHKFFKQTV